MMPDHARHFTTAAPTPDSTTHPPSATYALRELSGVFAG